MIMAMILAHLVGDYVLQWDKLAMWKARALSGVTMHCLVVSAVTFLCAYPFGGRWVEVALGISLGHYIIDAAQLPITAGKPRPGIFALVRFTADQVAHLLVIFGVLYGLGYFVWGGMWNAIAQDIARYPILIYAVGYTSLAMPAWVMLEFAIYGLFKRSAPDFSKATNKYVGSMERWLILTCILLGQYLLVPVVAAPRFLFERPRVGASGGAEMGLYVAKLVASVLIAVGIGLAVREVADVGWRVAGG